MRRQGLFDEKWLYLNARLHARFGESASLEHNNAKGLGYGG
jgi:hypothetical protein